ncbi:MAG: B12-binding domain-containing radical SAM protein [Candidatus Methylomirabilia bacterium]
MRRLYLINPDNPIVSLTKLRWSRLNKYRMMKPLNLLTLARLTPPDWSLEVIDENLGPVDYRRLPRPDLVGITAFTSQVTRAYEVASIFREMGVPVVMGGIHVTMCLDEALQYADAVLTGEAESLWGQVLEDVKNGGLQRVYRGGLSAMETIPPARHDLLSGVYYSGSIQTTRGCPLRCTFCSVTAFNGGTFRFRPIPDVIAELRQIREPRIFFVDDNLIGTRHDHIARSKELFRAMIDAGQTRPWSGQATINFADDKELLDVAAQSGCEGVYIGFESATVEALTAVHKKFNIQEGRDFRASVRRIQRHGMLVVGSFIIGIDTDRPGISEVIAGAADQYGVDMANVLILTPLPGTKLHADMEGHGRIIADHYPGDWQYYTLGYPVAHFTHFTWAEIVGEMNRFKDLFYSYPKILRRVLLIASRTRSPLKVLVGLVGNLGYRYSHLFHQRIYANRYLSAAGTETADAARSKGKDPTPALSVEEGTLPSR